MVWAACRKPRARSVNFSMSMSMSLSSGDWPQPRPSSGNGNVTLWQSRWVQARLRLKRERPMRIEYLYRYPVKGLTAEALEAAEVEAGGCIPWDRAFALAQGDAGFDPEQPQWLQKAQLHVPDEERADRRAVLVLRAAHRHAGDPRAGRISRGGERADRRPGASGSARSWPPIWARRRAARRASTTCPATASATSGGRSSA